MESPCTFQFWNTHLCQIKSADSSPVEKKCLHTLVSCCTKLAPTREMPVETNERLIKLLQDGKSSQNFAKDVGCSPSAVSGGAAVRESRNWIGEEYCLLIAKSMPRRIQVVIKARGGETKYQWQSIFFIFCFFFSFSLFLMIPCSPQNSMIPYIFPLIDLKIKMKSNSDWRQQSSSTLDVWNVKEKQWCGMSVMT